VLGSIVPPDGVTARMREPRGPDPSSGTVHNLPQPTTTFHNPLLNTGLPGLPLRRINTYRHIQIRVNAHKYAEIGTNAYKYVNTKHPWPLKYVQIL